MPVRHLLSASLLAGALVALPGLQPAQGQARGGSLEYDTRTQLQQEREDLRERLAVLDSGSDERERVQARLEQIQRRLERGDFRPGDAVEIRVPGSDTLSGVFQVDAQRRLAVPVIGNVDLDGVLYAEADSVLTQKLGEYVRTDRIRVRPLKRVAVLGSVGSPGYYDVPPSMTVSDLIMRAGGPTQGSDLNKVEIRRDGRTLASAEEGLRESSTLADLGVERGDQVHVPQSRGGSSLGTIMSVIGGLSGLAFAVTRVF